MPNKNYISGRNFEYRVKKYLEKEGWFVVRTAGSHSPVDLVAFSLAPLFIQCKNYDYPTRNELETMFKFIKSLSPHLSANFAFALNVNGKIVIRYINQERMCLYD